MSEDVDLFKEEPIKSLQRRKNRHPDYSKSWDFGTYKFSISIWVNKDSAVLQVSSFEHGRWNVKLREELPKWRT